MSFQLSDQPNSEQTAIGDEHCEEEASGEVLDASDFTGPLELPPEFAGGVTPDDFYKWYVRTVSKPSSI